MTVQQVSRKSAEIENEKKPVTVRDKTTIKRRENEAKDKLSIGKRQAETNREY
jgi:hypothetical protein